MARHELLDSEFSILSLKFRKPRTSDLEPSSVSPFPVRLSLRTQNSELLHPSRPTRLSRSPRISGCREVLWDAPPLGLQRKPFSLHLLNEGGTVHMEQLCRPTCNPVGLSERADNETVLELLEFS